jgi:hypothetical protein
VLPWRDFVLSFGIGRGSFTRKVGLPPCFANTCRRISPDLDLFAQDTHRTSAGFVREDSQVYSEHRFCQSLFGRHDNLGTPVLQVRVVGRG